LPRFKTTDEILKITSDKNHIRHVDHGKTTLSDSLLAASGLLSPSLAGQALALDYLEEEQKRQMTIKAANISLFHERKGEGYLINLIDTPGHVDFSGRVTRSLRAIDGAVVVVDSVEEVMVQTETVTRQAVEERVKPALYVNKIDRLIKEIKLTPQSIQEKLTRIINDFNHLIEIYAEPEFRDKWKVSPAAGTLAFGSAKDRWGLTLTMAQEQGIKFSDIIEFYRTDRVDELVKLAPLPDAILEMMIMCMPPPHVAQQYRVSRIWKGDLQSDVGKSMLECDDNGPIVMCVTNINVDPQAGLVATGRLFSGTIHEGDSIYLLNSKIDARIQQVCIYMGPYREVVGSLSAGNIPAVLGLPHARSGETISTVKGIATFEEVEYVTDPVMTMAIEPKNNRDLPKLVNFLRKLSIEDPTLVTKIDEETGEYLISGMGELHLEIANTWIQKAGLEIVTSKPTVIYRETIRGTAGPVESKSPNKHNRLHIAVEPLEQEIVDAIKKGEIRDETNKKDLAKVLRGYSWETDEARGVWAVDTRGNMLLDVTKGVQRLEHIKGSILIGFMDAMDRGPLAEEPVSGVKVKLTDATVHEDPVHIGPAQIIPATRHGIFATMLMADPTLLEPILKLNTRIPAEYVGAITSIIAQKRGKVLSIDQKAHLTYIIGEVPASQTFDLSEVVRSGTGGRAFWGTEFYRWATVPSSLQQPIIEEIRKRKGLNPVAPKPQDFLKP
jgi:elongation factor 2